ncbi:MAG: glycosyltransferase family 39 protein [Deltaproteobacteria bacterium]|jgi:4-amino-4-deoxy-L-arabinose transferase-like glycosyltransferase|nr:glycosyltransferase family 39 protein [Deltaproteobacteria bacterium]MBW2534655.1 glycosyltransferase family 39 protein [Deltaproteobacteria bacterium]
MSLVVRLAVVAWAWGKLPPVADGFYYHRLATRLADGHGYTWLWPDGAVTYAAHYPVGYPAALALLYRAFGPSPELGMLLNAMVGALGVLAVHRLLVPFRRRRVAWLGAGLVALHPGLVLYTPAIMTEGVMASLLAIAVWAAASARRARAPKRRWLLLALVGLLLGGATLVRPQSILLAPLLGLWIGARSLRGALTSGAVVTALALALCAPWTMRNCERMGRCALVSVNGGWNLLIGTDPDGRGAFAPLKVPDECREVFDEAEKDRCFERAAWTRIAAEPGPWLALAPRKLGVTFNYCGAAGWYLSEAGPAARAEEAKVAIGVVETIYQRLALLLALAAALPPGRVRRRLRTLRIPTDRAALRRAAQLGLIAVGAVFALLEPGWVAYVALAAALALRRPSLLRSSAVYAGTAAVLVTLMLTHALFFGAGRYSLVAFPIICALAAVGARTLNRVAGSARGPAPRG